MPSRFGAIKFSLLRAIELLQDMNHEDMDVMAPPSSRDFFKEQEVAQRLNECLEQLIREGLFDDCDMRELDSTEDDESYTESQLSTPESSGFELTNPSDAEGSHESLTGRFKRYIRRILPGGRSAKEDSEQSQSGSDVAGSNIGDDSDDDEMVEGEVNELDNDDDDYYGLSRSPSRSGSRSGSSESSRGSLSARHRRTSREGRSREPRQSEHSDRDHHHHHRHSDSDSSDSHSGHSGHSGHHGHHGHHHHHHHHGHHGHHSHHGNRSHEDPDLSDTYGGSLVESELSSGPLSGSGSSSRVSSRVSSRASSRASSRKGAAKRGSVGSRSPKKSPAASRSPRRSAGGSPKRGPSRGRASPRGRRRRGSRATKRSR